MYGRGSTPGNRPPGAPRFAVPIRTAPEPRAPSARRNRFANRSNVSGPGTRKNTQIQMGQWASRYNTVFRARIFRSLASSTGIPRTVSLDTASSVMSHFAPAPTEHKRERPDSTSRARASCNSRQRPTLPRGCPRSTIGGRGLNYRVRHGNGCFPSPMTTGKSATGEKPSNSTEASQFIRDTRHTLSKSHAHPAHHSATEHPTNGSFPRRMRERIWSSLTAD